MRMRDEKGLDDKIIAVSTLDPAFNEYSDHTQLPGHTLREIKRFFEDYKLMEGKAVEVDELQPADATYQVIEDALARYSRHRRGGFAYGK